MTVENRKQPFPSRRDFISLGIGAFVVGTIPFAARGRTRLVRRTLPVMGTLGEVAVVHKDERYAQGAIDAAFQELQRVESAPHPFPGRTRRSDGRTSRPSPALRTFQLKRPAVLRSALRWADATEGAFDPCLGRAVALWDVGNRTQPPEAEEVHRFARRGLFRSLELGESRGQRRGGLP